MAPTPATGRKRHPAKDGAREGGAPPRKASRSVEKKYVFYMLHLPININNNVTGSYTNNSILSRRRDADHSSARKLTSPTGTDKTSELGDDLTYVYITYCQNAYTC